MQETRPLSRVGQCCARALGTLILMSLAWVTARAQAALPDIYAQVLIDRIAAQHPGLEQAAIYGYAPGAPVSAFRIIAAKDRARIGDPADAMAFTVLCFPKAVFRHDEASGRYVAVLQLLDLDELPVGTLVLAYKYHLAADEAMQQKTMLAIRDGLKVYIPDRAALFASGRKPRGIFAQQLVDELMAKYPQLVRISFHVPPPGAPVENSYVIAGKDLTYVHLPMIGSPSGPEDFPHLTGGTSQFFFFKKQDFYKGMLPLENAAGRQIGVLLLGCKYASANDEPSYRRLMIHIRDELMTHIPTRAALFEPVR